MSSENRDYLELTYRSITCFTDDGKLDVNELENLVEIAMRDGVVDDNEKRVLRNIIERLGERDLTPEMMDKIHQLRADLDI